MSISMNHLLETVRWMPGNNLIYQLKDEQLKCIYYSEGIPGLSGCSMEEYKKVEDPFEFILVEDRIVIQKKIREELKSESYQKNDLLFRLIHKEKGFVWVHMTASKMIDDEGNLVFIANILDVTKEMLNSYALMEASDRGICVIEKATKRFLYANNLFYDLVDSTPAESMGKHCYEILCKAMDMKNNDNCLCYSSIDKTEPVETYNSNKKMNLTLTGRQIVWGEYDAYVFYMADVTKMKQKDDALQDSQKRFEVALANSDLMIWEYDIINHRCINSEKAGKDYNIPLVIENYPESLYQTGHVPPETIEQIKEVKQRLLNGETGFSVERRTIDKYGKSNWQKVDYTLECDELGTPIRAIVCGLDITAQKELEQKYEEQMEYRNNLAKKALFSIRLDLDADLVSDYTCNEPLLQNLAVDYPKASGFLKQFFATSIFDEGGEFSKKSFESSSLKQAYSFGRGQYQCTYQCSLLNKYLELNLTMYKNPGTMHLEVFFVVMDVTENELTHIAFQTVVSKDYDYVAVVNTLNQKVQFLAQTDAELIPKLSKTDPETYDVMVLKFAQKHRDIFYSGDDFQNAGEGMQLSSITSKLKETPVYEFNYKTRGTDGAVQTYRMSFSYSDKRQTQIIFSRTNITKAVEEEQRNQLTLEKALKAARQADQAKTDFLSRMSHDMRTPMNGIIGMTKLTQDIPSLPDEAQKNLLAIEDSSRYLLRLINDTLDMNKIESNRFQLHTELVNANELIQHILATVRPLIGQKQIRLEFVPINANLNYIIADRIRVQQVLLNVLSNAVKFTPVGGHIRLEVECFDREKERANARISVEDNGCGMSAEFLSHIFEPFTQENNKIVGGQEGTGLGMAIVKNLVELMGGRIEIWSEQGKGTKVTAYIPFTCVEHVPEELSEKKEAVSLEEKRVLLVEDHPLNAEIARQLLQKKKMIVEHAENGVIAVSMFDASKLHYYDLVLMDIRMPEMDGLEATRRIRALERADAQSVPILAMTANAYASDVRDALEAGMNAHLAKPIEPEVLYLEIEKYL